MAPHDRDVPTWVQLVTGLLVPPQRRARYRDLAIADGGHGYDVFGAHRAGAALADLLTGPLYERYFRVDSRGHAHIPAQGPVIVAANHSGTLPFDAMMIYADLLRRTDPPRLPRAVADTFVSALPWINVLFARGGAVAGARRNVEKLLERGELVLIFPEGVPGISKPFRERYKLQRWRGGHAELAIRYGATVVPAALVGAEEQMPQIGRIPVSVFGAPFIPVPATPVPLPVRYHLRYGPPIRFEDPPDTSDDPEVIRRAAERVRDAVQDLLDQALSERRGIFR